MKKALFIDRDGTIIVEPEDEQIDTLEKMEFLPHAISALASLRGLDYELVLASNQDGLGTAAYPLEAFRTVHAKLLTTLHNEGVWFDDELIDPTCESEHAPTRKPEIGMFTKYMTGDYDLAQSYVIGDRVTDIRLARNLGTKGILIADPEVGKAALRQAGLEEWCLLVSPSWSEIAEFIRLGSRYVELRRTTRETGVRIRLDLDGRGDFNDQITTGIGFFDHMLSQIAHHGGVALSVEAKGDLQVDEHHTVEDVGITLGEAIDKALGSKVGIARYGFALPMDDSSAQVLIDFGGRIDFRWEAEFKRERIGELPTELLPHFFQSLASAARCNLQIKATGENEHHKAEAIFKAFARALRMAVKRDPTSNELPTSKGLL